MNHSIARAGRAAARRLVIGLFLAALAGLSPSAAGAAGAESAPDLFGSVALRVSSTAYDGSWSRVRTAKGEGAAWAGLLADGRAAPTRRGQVEAVNAGVNRLLEFRSDLELYGRSDHWAAPHETLLRRAGDCEDYAILKMAVLAALGVPAQDMYLVVLQDLAARAPHAVLAVRVDRQVLILDNRSDLALPAETLGDYRPVVTLSAQGAWIHGQRSRPLAAPASVVARADAPGRVSAGR